MLQRLIISAPFGNYLHFQGTTPTLGTFTWARRGGALRRLWRVAQTVRYYPGIRAWKNRLGLPNPGLSALPAGADYSTSILSLAGFTLTEWRLLLQTALMLRPAALELNVSCPNVAGDEPHDAFAAAREVLGSTTCPLLVKLPPVGYGPLAEAALTAGLTAFHCCNTLPTPCGGLSGKPLKPLSLQAVRDVSRLLGARKQLLIGGGGISHVDDAHEYQAAGATHVAVGSAWFFPWKWPALLKIRQAFSPRSDA